MVRIAPAQPADAEAIAELVAEMDDFYAATTDPPAERRAGIHQALFADTPSAAALLAWDDDDTAVGIATYSLLWPAAGVTASLYLKELFVTRRRQRDAIGTRLMQAVVDQAIDLGCSRVEWTTDTDNAGAQRFYEQLGYSPLPSKIFYRHPIAERRDA